MSTEVELSADELEALLAETETETVTASMEPTPTPDMYEVATPEPTPGVREKGSKASDSGLLIDPEKLGTDVRINPADIDGEMVRHASLFVHYATNTVKARKLYERAKAGFEILEAKLDAEYRETFVAAGQKVTEAAIRNALVADTRWSGGNAKVIEAQANWRLCEVAEESFRQRKDLLLEIARNARQERGLDMSVRNQDAVRAAVVSELQASRQKVA